VDQGFDEEELLGAGGPELRVVIASESLELVGVLAGDDASCASAPCWRAFIREAALPSSVRGPVDFIAFRRLAAI